MARTCTSVLVTVMFTPSTPQTGGALPFDLWVLTVLLPTSRLCCRDHFRIGRAFASHNSMECISLTGKYVNGPILTA
jgi:hypothetical protein